MFSSKTETREAFETVPMVEQSDINTAIIDFLVAHMLPCSLVSYEEFRNLLDLCTTYGFQHSNKRLTPMGRHGVADRIDAAAKEAFEMVVVCLCICHMIVLKFPFYYVLFIFLS